VQRRAVTAAFGAGLAICFVPLPIHIPLGFGVAVLARVNVPVILATVLLVNPLTVVPVYYAAYRIGAALLQYDPQPFEFSLSWEWLQHGLGPLWKPFLTGCLVCGTTAGFLGWLGLESFWRWRVTRRYRLRRENSSS
jgi:hypothetical protein